MPAPVVSLTALQITSPMVPVQAGVSTLSIDSSVLPFVIVADANTSRLEVAIYNQTLVFLNPTTSGTTNTFTGSIAINTSIPETSIQFTGRNYNPSVVWTSLTAFNVGDRIIDSNGNVQVVITAGTTGTIQPIWGITAGAQVTDGSVTWQFVGVPAITPSFMLTLLYFDSGLALQISPPSALKAYKGSISCQLEWATPTFAGFLGVRVVISTDSSGVNVPYSQFGDIVSTISRTANNPVTSTSTTTNNTGIIVISTLQTGGSGYAVGDTGVVEDGFGATYQVLTVNAGAVTSFTIINPGNGYTSGLVTTATGGSQPGVGTGFTINIVTQDNSTTTTVSTVQTTNYSSVFVPTSAVTSDEFYALFSTVIQDPITNVVFESQQNGPLTAGFVNLKKVNPTDFLGLQRKEDIASRLIAQINRAYPSLDLTPRSELRDLIIDPIAVELSNMSVREWFSHAATSISAISQIDDANNDGQSDAFSTSPIKQQISRAYGLNATDTQSLIDKQFDILGEQAGIVRGGSTFSVVNLTFYVFTAPTQNVTIPQGAVVATTPNTQTPALNFVTAGSATITPTTAPSFFNVQQDWYQVVIPAQCTTSGSIGNVGVGTITTVVSGIPQGWNVTNMVPANFGTDEESNYNYASMIQDRIVTGIDSSTRNGYRVAAQSVPTIIAVNIVAAGDLEMLRDWDPIRQKHVFGCVDIYVRGSSDSQQTTNVLYQYQNNAPYGDTSAYTTLTLLDRSLCKFAINNFSNLPFPIEQAVEILVTRGGSTFYLGTVGSTVDNAAGVLFVNPNELAYTLVGNSVFQAPQPLVIGGVSATNAAAINALSSAASGTYTISMFARFQSPLLTTPALQPLIQVNSVTGNEQTGVVPITEVELIRTQDFLLNGGSQDAGDQVEVPASIISQQTINLSLIANTVQIDTAMSIDVDTSGNVVLQKTISGQVVPSIVVRSSDLSTLYVYGTDYTLSRTGTYNTWSLVWVPTGSIPAPAATNPPILVVSYYKFTLTEQLTFINGENDTLTGTIPTTLDNTGFVDNVWLPVSYGNEGSTLPTIYNTLAFDGYNVNPLLATGLVGAGVPYADRYIKVTLQIAGVPVVMREGIDFTLTVDPISGTATLARILTGAIPSGATVQVSYFINETFAVNTEYPAFVEQLVTVIDQTKSAAADVLVKAMIANPIDMTFVIQLSSNASADVVDPQIRDIISIVLDNVNGTTLFMAEVVAQIMTITGVENVQLPLLKFAKSDGDYDIGIVIPTQTVWNPLSSDPAFSALQLPANSFITASPVLPDATIPGGGLSTAYVGLLYEGQAFRRATSIQDFLTNSSVPSFYFIGTNDQISPTQPLGASYDQRVLITTTNFPTVGTNLVNPGLLSYFATYQVFGEGGAKDITTSSTEYFVPGNIVINYITSS
jgi:hypothetical protein